MPHTIWYWWYMPLLMRMFTLQWWSPSALAPSHTLPSAGSSFCKRGVSKSILWVSTMTKVLLATLLSTAVLIQCQDSELATYYTYCYYVLYFTVTLVQTSPSYSKVCPHDNVTINCTTYNSDDLVWYQWSAHGQPSVLVWRVFWPTSHTHWVCSI